MEREQRRSWNEITRDDKRSGDRNGQNGNGRMNECQWRRVCVERKIFTVYEERNGGMKLFEGWRSEELYARAREQPCWKMAAVVFKAMPEVTWDLIKQAITVTAECWIEALPIAEDVEWVCVGLLLNIWNDEVFKEIGHMFGGFTEVTSITSEKKAIRHAFLKVKDELKVCMDIEAGKRSKEEDDAEVEKLGQYNSWWEDNATNK
ncbi:hypothetical protein Scep_005239 [Stephania cephalantha]|uniref:DUF4283 domain-containing protein n=1 Tax=Stephania cephalantha TaxID=152367 RepID=A0AAP0PXB4_9MAGN